MAEVVGCFYKLLFVLLQDARGMNNRQLTVFLLQKKVSRQTLLFHRQ